MPLRSSPAAIGREELALPSGGSAAPTNWLLHRGKRAPPGLYRKIILVNVTFCNLFCVSKTFLCKLSFPKKVWTQRDSNPWLPRCKRGALPAETTGPFKIFKYQITIYDLWLNLKSKVSNRKLFHCGWLTLIKGDKAHSKKPPIRLVITSKPIKITIKPISL